MAWRKSYYSSTFSVSEYIVSFCLCMIEQNRQSYAQLFVASKDSSKKLTGKGRGKGEDISSKDANLVAGPEKDKVISANETLKAFCIRFVRLNGILFTRTRYFF